MSALPYPCPVADPFAAADQAYATITEFLHSKEACQVKHSELERQLEGMGRELMRKLLQAHLDMRQPGQAVEAVSDAAGTPLTPTPAMEPQAHLVCTRWTVRSICRRRSTLWKCGGE
jgi:hypothetical protein